MSWKRLCTLGGTISTPTQHLQQQAQGLLSNASSQDYSPSVNTSDVSWCQAPVFRAWGVVFQALQHLLCCYKGSASFAEATGKASCNPPTHEQPSEDHLSSAVQGIL